MNLFKEEYKKDLMEIEKLLETETDIDIKNTLLKDKDYITNCLNPNLTSLPFKYKSKENKDEILKMLNINSIRYINIKKIKSTNNTQEYNMLFNEFIYQDKFNLKEVLKNIESYNGIKYKNNANSYWGSTSYIPSLKKNYIEICKTDNIYEYVTLIHELGHAKINLEGNKYSDDSIKSSFDETYSIFLELMFARFLKKRGYLKESYEIKQLIYKQINDFLFELSEEYYQYLDYSKNQSLNKYFFEYKYKYLKNILLALQFYYMYKSHPNFTMSKIEYFLTNIHKISDEQLLKDLEIDIYFFNNKNVSKLYNELVVQRKKITGKRMKIFERIK